MAVHVSLPDNSSAILQSLGDRDLLFVESEQAVYEVGDPGRVTEAFPFKPLRQARQVSADLLTGLTLSIADVPIHLHLPASLLGPTKGLLSHLFSRSEVSASQLCVRLAGDQAIFEQTGRAAWPCPVERAIPALKAMLVGAVLDATRYDLALHAAAVVERDTLILLLGKPGAGKSSMALALNQAGLALAADDVTLLHASGRGTGLRLPLTAKASAWRLLSQRYPDIELGQPYKRPDGQWVCYILPQRFAPSVSMPIGGIVILDRRDSAEPLLEAVDPLTALSSLLEDAAARGDRLSEAAFVGLATALHSSRCLRLTYSDLAPASQLLKAYLS